MPKKYKYYPDTPTQDNPDELQEWAAEHKAEGACLDSFNFHEIKRHEVEAAGKIATCGDMARDCPNEDWMVISFRFWGKEQSPELRKICLEKITTPLIALHLYMELDFWTEEEDAILEAKFEGKLPQAEKELREGTIQIVRVAVDG